jgi:hypothetical protein
MHLLSLPANEDIYLELSIYGNTDRAGQDRQCISTNLNPKYQPDGKIVQTTDEVWLQEIKSLPERTPGSTREQMSEPNGKG